MINDCESKDKWTGDNLNGNPSESRYINVAWNDWFFDVFQSYKSWDVSIYFLKVHLKESFLMSATLAVSNVRSNDFKFYKINCSRYKHLLKLRFVFLAFADASYTTLSFMVRLFDLLTSRCGMSCLISTWIVLL